MNYVDRYAELFREAADRQARAPARRWLPGRLPGTRVIALAAALACAAAVAVSLLSGSGERERVAAPEPDPARIDAIVDDVMNGRSHDPPCLPARPGGQVTAEPLAAETREAFGVLRRPAPPRPALVEIVRRSADPRSVVVASSVRVLRSRRDRREVLYVMRGPSSPFLPRDPERCAELERAALERRLESEPAAVARAARARLEAHERDRRRTLEERIDRLHIVTVLPGGITAGSGGATVAQARLTGMGGSGVRGGARHVEGLVPDGVATVEVVARGGGARPWVRRHRVRVRDNYFHLDRFHAKTFRVRWLDARGEEIARPGR